METKFIEVTNNEQNWGKFMLARFTPEEWTRRSAIDPPASLVRGRGWTPDHLLVFDLQTGEGAMFRPGGNAHADLDKHRVWVCPMFEPFLEWLYEQKLDDLDALPAMVNLPDAPFAFAGYRRAGPGPISKSRGREAAGRAKPCNG